MTHRALDEAIARVPHTGIVYASGRGCAHDRCKRCELDRAREDVERLVEALRNLHAACLAQAVDDDLFEIEPIDGSLLDAATAALAAYKNEPRKGNADADARQT